MSSTPETPNIDLNAISSEVAGLSKEQLEAEVLKLRVRQKKQQKKQQGSGAQKAYQLKQRAKFNAMKAKAIELGIWDKINDEAEKQAETELASEEVPADETAA